MDDPNLSAVKGVTLAQQANVVQYELQRTVSVATKRLTTVLGRDSTS